MLRRSWGGVTASLNGKANLSDIVLPTSGTTNKGKWVKFGEVDLSGATEYEHVTAIISFIVTGAQSPNGLAVLHVSTDVASVAYKEIRWIVLNNWNYHNSLAVTASGLKVGVWYHPINDYEIPALSVVACYGRHRLRLAVEGSYQEDIGEYTGSTCSMTSTWSNLMGKPSTYPPATHNHDAAYVAKTSAGVSAAINLLSTGAATPTDNDYMVTQYAGGGTTVTSYHRRPMSALWEYIKTKCDERYQLKE